MTNEEMQAEIETMLAIQVGLTSIVASLIATHPHYDRFQIHQAGVLELMLNGAAGKTLTEKQRQSARSFVETLQGLNKAPSKIDPLAALLGR